MEQDSVSKIKLILELRGKAKLNCELKRHLSPRTVGIISRCLPLEGNAHLLGNSIAFLPANGSICFFFENTSSTKTMTPIGKITSDSTVLQNIKPGDVILLYTDIG